MLVVPLSAVPSQIVTTNLNNQPCQIAVYQKLTGMFIDLYVNDVLIVGGVECENVNRIVRDVYLGFSGDLLFLDNQPSQTDGPSDPFYTGLGTRFTLMYLFPTELTGDD